MNITDPTVALVTFERLGEDTYEICAHRLGDATLRGEILTTCGEDLIPQNAVPYDQTTVGKAITPKAEQTGNPFGFTAEQIARLETRRRNTRSFPAQMKIDQELKTIRASIARTPKSDPHAALIALYAAGETLLEFWSHGTPVHPGSDAAADFTAAMIRARSAV